MRQFFLFISLYFFSLIYFFLFIFSTFSFSPFFSSSFSPFNPYPCILIIVLFFFLDIAMVGERTAGMEVAALQYGGDIAEDEVDGALSYNRAE